MAAGSFQGSQPESDQEYNAFAMKKKLVTLVRVMIFFGIGFAILYLLYRNQNAAFLEQCRLDGTPADQCSLLDKIWQDFRNTHFIWIFIMLIAFMVSNISRAIRWNMLIRPLGYQPRLVNSFLIVMLGYFANLGLPRLGEVLRAGALAKYEKIPAEKVMGTVVADRAFDLIALALFIAAAFFLEFDLLWGWLKVNAFAGESNSSPFQNPILWAVGGLIVLSLLLIGIFRQRILQTVFVQKIIRLLRGFAEGILTVRKLERPGWFVFHSLFIWLMYYLMAYLCFFAFEPTQNLSPVAGLMVFVFGAFGIVIPSPGGMGTYHALVIAALSLYGISKFDAFSFANIIYFSIQIFANVLFGMIALLFLPVINRHYHPKAGEPIDTAPAVPQAT